MGRQIDDDNDPYVADEIPDEKIRPDWVLGYSNNPDHIRAVRRGHIESHKAHVLLARLLTEIGMPQFCAIQRCKRINRCAGNKRDTEGFHVGLYRINPPCFFAYQGVLYDEVFSKLYKPLRERAAELEHQESARPVPATPGKNQPTMPQSAGTRGSRKR